MAVPISGTAYRYYKELLIPHTHTHTHTRIHGRTSTCAHTHASQVIVVPISPSLKPPLNMYSKELLIPHTHTHTHTHTRTYKHTCTYTRITGNSGTHQPIIETTFEYLLQGAAHTTHTHTHTHTDTHTDTRRHTHAQTCKHMCTYTRITGDGGANQ